jgi:hypothetical protein
MVMLNKYHKQIIEKIKNYPSVILLNGPSIQNLENYIEKLRDKEVLYYAINNRFIIEDNILSKIGKKVHIWCMFSQEEVPKYWRQIYQFLSHNESLLFITSANALYTIADVISYRELPNPHKIFIADPIMDQVVFRLNNTDNSKNYLNTLFFLLSVILSFELKIQTVFLFGCDGVNNDDKIHYYKQDKLRHILINRSNNLLNDCVVFNERWQTNVESMFKCRNIKIPKVLNVNTCSHYHCFPKILYRDAIKELCNCTVSQKESSIINLSTDKDSIKIHNDIVNYIRANAVNKDFFYMEQRLNHKMANIESRLMHVNGNIRRKGSISPTSNQ